MRALLPEPFKELEHLVDETTTGQEFAPSRAAPGTEREDDGTQGGQKDDGERTAERGPFAL